MVTGRRFSLFSLYLLAGAASASGEEEQPAERGDLETTWNPLGRPALPVQGAAPRPRELIGVAQNQANILAQP